MVLSPNIKLPTEKECLRKKIRTAKRTKAQLQKKLDKLLSLNSADMRGSEINARVQKLDVKINHFDMVIKNMEFDEEQVDHIHVDVEDKVETTTA